MGNTRSLTWMMALFAVSACEPGSGAAPPPAGGDGDVGADAATADRTSLTPGDVAPAIDAPAVDATDGVVVVPDARPPAADGGTFETTPPAMGACLGAVEPELLRAKLAQLSGASPVMIDGQNVTIPQRYTPAMRARARAFLTAEYRALGLTVTEQAYASGVNLIAERPGKDQKLVIVSAHYDTVMVAPGADDDGTGVIAGLATARALQGCQLDHTLRIVAFDEEEKGLLGSKAYTADLRRTAQVPNVIGDVQLEMLGYHSKNDGGFLLVDCDRADSKPLSDLAMRAITRGNLALKVYKYCARGSDHSPFWDVGAPAIAISQEFFLPGADSTPCYHRACDAMDRINLAYFTKLTTLALMVTADLVGAR